MYALSTKEAIHGVDNLFHALEIWQLYRLAKL